MNNTTNELMMFIQIDISLTTLTFVMYLNYEGRTIPILTPGPQTKALNMSKMRQIIHCKH